MVLIASGTTLNRQDPRPCSEDLAKTLAATHYKFTTSTNEVLGPYGFTPEQLSFTNIFETRLNRTF